MAPIVELEGGNLFKLSVGLAATPSVSGDIGRFLPPIYQGLHNEDIPKWYNCYNHNFTIKLLFSIKVFTFNFNLKKLDSISH